MNLFQMNAIHGDGTVQWYGGEATPRVRTIVQKLNDHLGSGIVTIDPTDEDNDDRPFAPDQDEVCVIGDEQQLIDTLVWWCNGAPDSEGDYEYLPAGANRTDHD